MTERHEYSTTLADFDPCSPSMAAGDLQLRAVLSTDANAIAELMVEAYRGTIDDEGESLEDAIGEVTAYLAGERGGQPLLRDSRLAIAGPQLIGACLAADWNERRLPLIVYVMTCAQWKNRGVGKQLLWAVMQALREQGHHEVRAVITKGNTPSERLFGRMGFQKVDIV